jgi:glycosyltransferase involved in cell wall biosynthesis
MDSRVPDEIVTVTGHYEPEQLAEIIKNSEVNIFLFPSIVPETFSYVAHELVAMGVPLACFNMGAPAELVRTYKNGLALGSMEAGAILTELEKFRRKIYQISDD